MYFILFVSFLYLYSVAYWRLELAVVLLLLFRWSVWFGINNEIL